jgi:hypothetical protein
LRTNQAKERRRAQAAEAPVPQKAGPKKGTDPRPPVEAKVRPVRSAGSGPLPPDTSGPIPAELHFGILLRRARERRGLTQQDVVRTTRIAERWLPALEEARLDLLPAPVFVTGYVRSYARLVGLDEEDLVERYQGLTQQRSEQAALAALAEAPLVPAGPSQQRRALVVGGCLVGLLCLLGAVLALLLLRR